MNRRIRLDATRAVCGGVAGILVAMVSAGCATTENMPPIAELYSEAAKYHEIERNPVIVIPGILGSRLEDDASGRVVWGAFSGKYANPETADGARLVALPMALGRPLRELRDDVQPVGVLDSLELSLIGVPVQLKAYVNILKTLGAGGYRDEELGQAGAIDYGDDHFTCFQFAYDWRRDNVENAQRLHDFVVEKKKYVEAEYLKRYGMKKDVRFDIVAHSMGGLVTRYFLRYGNADLPDEGDVPPPTWAGAKYVERAILVGTPNAGSLESWLNLMEGKKFAPILPAYDAAILGTHPAIYQLMPRPRHKPVSSARKTNDFLIQLWSPEEPDIYSPAVWSEYGWGLANPHNDKILRRLMPNVESAKERREVALDQLEKCLNRAKQFATAMDLAATPPEHLNLILFAGDAIQTAKSAHYDRERDRISDIKTDCGDGTVLRSSALMDERVGQEFSPHLKSPISWSRVQFLFSDHVGLTRDNSFADNVLYELLESPRMHGHE